MRSWRYFFTLTWLRRDYVVHSELDTGKCDSAAGSPLFEVIMSSFLPLDLLLVPYPSVLTEVEVAFVLGGTSEEVESLLREGILIGRRLDDQWAILKEHLRGFIISHRYRGEPVEDLQVKDSCTHDSERIPEILRYVPACRDAGLRGSAESISRRNRNLSQ